MNRGRTSPLALALLGGIVVTGALTVVLFGGGLVETLTSTAENQRAAQEMSRFASETAAVARGGSRQRRVDCSATAGTLTVEPEARWICVRNGSVDDRESLLPDVTASDTSPNEHHAMGSMVSDTGDGSVAYEGGGVWRTDEQAEAAWCRHRSSTTAGIR
jgi:hypothetical protein